MCGAASGTKNMDNDFGLDLDDVKRVIGSADVLLLRFVILPQRLLLDARWTDLEGPMVRVVPRVNSARERFRELKQLRPRFPLPERITAIAWPRRIESLVTTGVWAAVEQRLAASSFTDASAQAATVLEELKRLERAEMQNAIRGEGYQTYWERPC